MQADRAFLYDKSRNIRAEPLKLKRGQKYKNLLQGVL